MTTIEAAPTLTPRSADICGSRESDTRTIDWLAKEATASSVMALVALPRETGGVGDKVDSRRARRAFYRASIFKQIGDDR